MGNDGGSHQNARADMAKAKNKEIKIDNEIAGKNKYQIISSNFVHCLFDINKRASFCALSKEKLSSPIAICRLGFIFNY